MFARSARPWIAVFAVLLLSASWLLAGGAVAQGSSAPQTPQAASCASPTVTITSAVVKGYTVTLNGGILIGPDPNCHYSYNTTAWGDGFTSTGPAFPQSYTYGAAGSYTIKVTVYTLNYTTGATGSNSASTTVSVHGPPYSVQVNFDQSYHLPGDIATLYISVINSTTTAPQTGVGTFYVTSCYYTITNPFTCATVSTIPTAPAASNLASFPFTVPPNANPGSILIVNVEVNATLPTGSYSENGSSSLSIASPNSPALCASPTSTSGPCVSSYPPHEDFILSITGTLSTSSGTAAWANAFVKVVFYLNNQLISPTNFPASLTTNSQGVASAVVVTTNMPAGSLNITATIEDFNATPSLSQSSTIFVQLSPVPSVQVVVTLDYSAYYGGDTVNGRFALTTYSGTVPSGWTVNRYMIVFFTPTTSCAISSMFGSGYKVLAYGTSVTGTSGTVPKYTVPSNLQGSIDVAVFANNATQAAYGQTCALVSEPALEVQPSETYYRAGDSISVTLTPQGSVFNGAQYFAEVSGSYNGQVVILYNNSLGSSTSFGFSIPSSGALPTYVLTVAAQTTSYAIISAADVTLYEYSGYALQVSIQTKSAYSTGAFKPGDTVTFAYTVTPLGTAAAVKTFTLSTYYYNGISGTTSVLETSAQGTISVQIPSSSGDGVNIVYFSASIPVSGGSTSTSTLVGVLVAGSPSPLDYELFGAGSSFTVTDLLVIVVLVVAALIVGLVWRRRRRGATGIQVERKHRWGKHKNEGVSQWPQQPGAEQQPPAQGDYSQAPPPMQPYGSPSTDPQQQQAPGLPGDQTYNYPPQ